MDPQTLEAPVAPAPEASQGFGMEGLEAAVEQSNQQIQQPEAPAPKAAPKARKAAPEAKPEPNPAAKPWETPLEAAEEPEPEPEAPQVEEPPADMKPEAKTRWGELRKIEETYKKMAPEVEKLRKENEELRNTPTKIPDEIAAELEELRSHRAAYAVEATPEWKENIEAPYADAVSRLSEITDFAKVDFDKVMKASEEPNRIARNRQIKAILEESEVEVTESEKIEASKAVEDIVALANKASGLRAKAKELQNGFEGKSRATQEAETQKVNQTLSKSAEEVSVALQSSFKATNLFSNADFAKEILAARPANIAEDPNQAVYEAQAGKILPALVTKYNELAQKARELTKALNSRNASSPSSRATPAAGAPAAVPKEHATLESSMNELESLVRSTR